MIDNTLNITIDISQNGSALTEEKENVYKQLLLDASVGKVQLTIPDYSVPKVFISMATLSLSLIIKYYVCYIVLQHYKY